MCESMEAVGRGLLKRLMDAGYSAYFVGGYVRDRLMLRPCHDIDIATNAQPEAVMELFENVIPTGLKHGTVTVRLEYDSFEVTTFRVEGGYSDGRRPDDVNYVQTIEEDLSRRDFTMNALAMTEDGRLIDPFGGQNDIAGKRIRAVGDPILRFREDALRMMRAIRFAVQLQFELAAATKEAIRLESPLLKKISMERLRDEMNKILTSSFPHKGLDAMQDFGIWDVLFEKKVNLGFCDELPKDDLIVRWAWLILLYNTTKDEGRRLLRRWRHPVKIVNSILLLADLTQRIIEVFRSGTVSFGHRRTRVQWLLKYGLPAIEDAFSLVDVLQSYGRLDKRSLTLVLASFRKEAQGLPITKVSELNIRGDELMVAFDRKPGPWVSMVLEYLLEEAALGYTPNEAGMLLNKAREWIERADGVERK